MTKSKKEIKGMKATHSQNWSHNFYIVTIIASLIIFSNPQTISLCSLCSFFYECKVMKYSNIAENNCFQLTFFLYYEEEHAIIVVCNENIQKKHGR